MPTKKTHYYRATILERHLDSLGHVNHAEQLKLFEEARWQLLTERGYGLDTVKTTHIAPIVIELKVRFKKEVLLGQHITIDTQFVESKKIFYYIYQTMMNAKGTVMTTATITGALFDLQKRALVGFTPLWKEAMGSLTTIPNAKSGIIDALP